MTAQRIPIAMPQASKEVPAKKIDTVKVEMENLGKISKDYLRKYDKTKNTSDNDDAASYRTADQYGKMTSTNKDTNAIAGTAQSNSPMSSIAEVPIPEDHQQNYRTKLRMTRTTVSLK